MAYTKILQINANRSHPALDLALATGRQVGASVVLISEPNRAAIQSRKDWFTDPEWDTAIKVVAENLVILGSGSGAGFTYVTTQWCTIYNCYASPNQELEEMDRALKEISNQMRRDNCWAIIAGDFNAKSPQWGNGAMGH